MASRTTSDTSSLISETTALDLVRHGHLDDLVRRRRAIRAAAISRPPSPSAAALTALAARAFFLAGEAAEARALLTHFTTTCRVDDSWPPLTRSLFRTQLAVSHYGLQQYPAAAHEARLAYEDTILLNSDISVDHLLASANAAIWAARAEWRYKGTPIARSYLEEALRALTTWFSTPAVDTYRPGLAVAMAECLSVLGAIAWAAGQNRDAKSRIYRCIAVLNITGDVQASLFKWFAVHLAAKCDATASSHGFHWALALANLAVAGLTKASTDLQLHGNAWLAAALLQRAKTRIKATQRAEAYDDLKLAEDEADSLRAKNPEEATQILVESEMSRIWLAAQQAEASGSTKDWNTCAILAQSLSSRAVSSSSRVKAELAFQYGRALINLDTSDDLERGRSILNDEAIPLASHAERTNIHGAALLALAHSYIITEQYEKAGKYLNDSRTLRFSKGAVSAYLDAWDRDLERRLHARLGAGAVTLDMNTTYDEFIEKARSVYAGYHAQVAKTPAVFKERTGLSRSSFFRARQVRPTTSDDPD